MSKYRKSTSIIQAVNKGKRFEGFLITKNYMTKLIRYKDANGKIAYKEDVSETKRITLIQKQEMKVMMERNRELGYKPLGKPFCCSMV